MAVSSAWTENNRALSADEPHRPRYQVGTIFGEHDRGPFVVVNAPDLTTMLEPDEARRLGLDLIRAAEAATSDAMLVRFVDKTLGAPSAVVTAALADLRRMRGEIEGG